MVQKRESMSHTRRTLVLVAVLFIIVFHMGSSMGKSLETPPSDSATRNILMRGAHPENHDAYLCTGYRVEEEELYIYKFEAMANASTAHHMLLYGCNGEPFSQKSIWHCPAMCRTGQPAILFAWAKNAPPTVLPKGVGLRIGRKSTIKTIVLQVHYAKSFTEKEKPDNSGIKLYTTKEKQPYVAGILLMMSTFFSIPPKDPAYPVDMSCVFMKDKSIFPFAYRTHAHGLGRVITGYQWNGTYHEIGKGNPQWPQAFYPVKDKIEVKPGDALAARCTFDSTDMTHQVRVGATGDDEMCNFYIMFYTDSSVENPSGECMNDRIPQLTGQNFPDDVSVPLPPNPALEEEAKGHHHHHHGGMAGSGGSDDDEQTDNKDKDGDQPADNGNKDSDHPADGNKDLSSNVNKNVQVLDFKSLETPSKEMPHNSYTANSVGLKNEVKTKLQTPPKPKTAKESGEVFQFDYDFDDLRPREVKYEKRHNHEYYDDFAANDLREKGMYHPSRVLDEELSRNRNKNFEAMNQEMQSFPRKNLPPRPQQQKPSPHSNDGRRGGGHNAGPGMPVRQSPPLSSPKQANNLAMSGQPAKIHSHIHFEHNLVFNSSWPENPLEIGQVGGIATDKEGNLYIFHRGSRVWEYDSFNVNNDFSYQNDPIEEDVVLILDSQGRFVRKFGAGQYFMPHGIEVDHEGNIWLTDVALHQVFKIPPKESKPSLVLGQRFQHSEDTNYFCKPADVAVLTTGEFFVADGYCNSRVLKFNKAGKLIKYWGQRDMSYSNESPPGAFNIPHSITVSEENNLVCVADRENGRIQCFDLEGNFKHIIQQPQFGPKLYAIEQCPMHGGVLFAVNGPAYDGPQDFSVQGFTLDIKTGDLIEMWNSPQHLKKPHDVCVHTASQSVYVGELNPRSVWKFSRTSMSSAHTPEKEHHHETPQGAFKIGNAGKSETASKSTTTEKIDTKADDESGEATVTNSSISSALNNKETTDRETSDFTPSIIIGILLVVPVVLLLVITLLVRAHQSGKLKCFRPSNKRVFNLQGFLGNSHKGFDPLSTEESDHDIDPDDSDHEEYLAPKKIKSKA